jgi:TatD DNase family protein
VITDTHAHVFWKSFDTDRDAVLDRARAAGVERMVVVGTDLASSRLAFELCRGREGLHPTAGIHPHDAEGISPGDLAAVEELCRLPECVAVGETGLDYFKEFSPRSDQRRAFRWHAELARRIEKPLVVHCRDAHRDVLELLREVPGVRGVMHCYTMGPDELPGFLELGFYISFSGVLTYPRNDANREAARLVPDERLLVETDCPYLAPQGRRGQRNEPAFVREVLDTLSAIRGGSFEDLCRLTSANAARLFALESSPGAWNSST